MIQIALTLMVKAVPEEFPLDELFKDPLVQAAAEALIDATGPGGASELAELEALAYEPHVDGDDVDPELDKLDRENLEREQDIEGSDSPSETVTMGSETTPVELEVSAAEISGNQAELNTESNAAERFQPQPEPPSQGLSM